jgi:hypothetical protein
MGIDPGADMMIVPTPQSIKEDENRDVFAEIFSGYEYASDMEAVMWAAYRYRGIGNADVDYWVQCMKGRAEILSYTYDLKFKAVSQLKSDIEQNGVDWSSSILKSKSTAKHFDPPSGSSALSSYVSEGDTTEFEQSGDSGLQTETAKDWMDGVPDVWREYAAEFRDLFYWGL